MKERVKSMLLMGVGILAGITLTSGAQAAAARLTATRSNCAVYINGQRTELTAYMINDENYVRLRDIGAKVGFNVYWDGTVQIETDKPYTGVAPEKQTPSGTVTLPTDGSRYIPKVGDVIPCDDGTLYTITDVSRWDANMFSEGPLPPLPTPTCDWNSFPTVELPAPEARHFVKSNGDYLYVRNLYETRRMQYTLMNLAGTNPETSNEDRILAHLRGQLGKSQRVLLLHLLDLEDDLREQTSLDSFLSGIRLARGIEQELGELPPYSFNEENEAQARQKAGEASCRKSS